MPHRSAVHRPRLPMIGLVSVLAGLLVAACGGGATQVPGSTASPSPVASGSPGSETVEPASVRFALDWTPNTNHTGLYVADARGWYDEAGVRLELLPYAGTTPEALMAAGQAECGISFQDAMTFAAAAGAPVVSVMAVLQRTASEVAVLASSDIERPSDLDGRVYAGFGYPNEEPTLRAMIRADGGEGEFTAVTLDSAAYEALYAGRADFSISFSAWEGVEAARRGIELRTFRFSDYGVPEFYQAVIACDARWVAREPDLARRFVEATARGYEAAVEDPEAAVGDLLAANPGVYEADPGLPLASQVFLVEGGYLVDEEGRVGTQTRTMWADYTTFLFESGLLTGPDGAPLDEAPDPSSLYTDDLLSRP
jgi:ABC-type nitrate/sulfonate/bicarbonate transport system substrate-binding protein